MTTRYGIFDAYIILPYGFFLCLFAKILYEMFRPTRDF